MHCVPVRVSYAQLSKILLMDKILHDHKDPKLWESGNYGIFLIMGNAGFCPSTVSVACVFSTKTLEDPGLSLPTDSNIA